MNSEERETTSIHKEIYDEYGILQRRGNTREKKRFGDENGVRSSTEHMTSREQQTVEQGKRDTFEKQVSLLKFLFQSEEGKGPVKNQIKRTLSDLLLVKTDNKVNEMRQAKGHIATSKSRRNLSLNLSEKKATDLKQQNINYQRGEKGIFHNKLAKRPFSKDGRPTLHLIPARRILASSTMTNLKVRSVRSTPARTAQNFEFSTESRKPFFNQDTTTSVRRSPDIKAKNLVWNRNAIQSMYVPSKPTDRTSRKESTVTQIPHRILNLNSHAKKLKEKKVGGLKDSKQTIKMKVGDLNKISTDLLKHSRTISANTNPAQMASQIDQIVHQKFANRMKKHSTDNPFGYMDEDQLRHQFKQLTKKTSEVYKEVYGPIDSHVAK